MNDPGLEHMSEEDILRLMVMMLPSDDPTDIEFGKRCGRELASRKPKRIEYEEERIS